jgi:hypothetical protein
MRPRRVVAAKAGSTMDMQKVTMRNISRFLVRRMHAALILQLHPACL